MHYTFPATIARGGQSPIGLSRISDPFKNKLIDLIVWALLFAFNYDLVTQDIVRLSSLKNFGGCYDGFCKLNIVNPLNETSHHTSFYKFVCS